MCFWLKNIFLTDGRFEDGKFSSTAGQIPAGDPGESPSRPTVCVFAAELPGNSPTAAWRTACCHTQRRTNTDTHTHVQRRSAGNCVHGGDLFIPPARNSLVHQARGGPHLVHPDKHLSRTTLISKNGYKHLLCAASQPVIRSGAHVRLEGTGNKEDCHALAVCHRGQNNFGREREAKSFKLVSVRIVDRQIAQADCEDWGCYDWENTTYGAMKLWPVRITDSVTHWKQNKSVRGNGDVYYLLQHIPCWVFPVILSLLCKVHIHLSYITFTLLYHYSITVCDSAETLLKKIILFTALHDCQHVLQPHCTTQNIFIWVLITFKDNVF